MRKNLTSLLGAFALAGCVHFQPENPKGAHEIDIREVYPELEACFALGVFHPDECAYYQIADFENTRKYCGGKTPKRIITVGSQSAIVYCDTTHPVVE